MSTTVHWGRIDSKATQSFCSLEPVLELLDLLWPLLNHVDHELCKKLQGLGLPAYFSLSWFITWFAHDCKKLEVKHR